ncbi:hypothetical protein ACHAQJ_002512 [Trichoderma viride]
MQFSVVALFAAGALAAVCPPGLDSNPQCCAANILGVAALDCETPHTSVHDGNAFQAACARIGKQPLCCAVPVANEALICIEALGTQ